MKLLKLKIFKGLEKGSLFQSKILTVIIMVLLTTMVFAEPKGIHEQGTGIEDPELKEAGQGTGQGLEGEAPGEPQLISAEQGEQTGEQVMAQNREKIQTGLANALTKVKNENARQRLQANLERWMEKYQARMQKMEGLEIEEIDEETGAVTIKAKEPVKWFGIIKGKATKRFEMDSKGKINEKAPWYRFLYSEETTQ